MEADATSKALCGQLVENQGVTNFCHVYLFGK